MRNTLVVSLFVLLLAGCQSETLYSSLDEAHANEMIVVLQGDGIKARKMKDNDGGWSVQTSAATFSDAVRALNTHGYPKDTFLNTGDIFKKKGIVSTPLEERARYVYALSQELSSTISSIDGVITARVHLALPEEDPLADKQKPASASIFIKHKTEQDFTSHIAAIKSLVVNSIEGVAYDNVSVALFAAQPMPTAPSDSADPTIKASLAQVSIFGLALIAVSIVITGMFLTLRRKSALALAKSTSASARLSTAPAKKDSA